MGSPRYNRVDFTSPITKEFPDFMSFGRTSIIAALPGILLTLWVPPALASDEVLQMVAGQQRVLSAPGVTRIAIGNPNVADVKVVSPSEVLVTATGDGRTELTIWSGARLVKYEVIVSSMDPRQVKREVDQLLAGRRGIHVRVVRDQVHIDGQVMTLEDLERAAEVAEMYPQVQNLVKLDPDAHQQIAAALNQELARVGLTNARATVVGKMIFLEGMVDSEADLRKAEFITKSLAGNVQSVLTVGASRLIEIYVEFVEVSKSSIDRLGIDWPTNLAGDVALTYARTDVIRGTAPNAESLGVNGTANASLGLALQFNDGISRILARPRLVAGSNQEATFLAGGEVPIPLITQTSSSVEFKEYGIRLRITPSADANGTIHTKILTEVSQLDESVSVMGIPGFLVRRVDTQVTVRDGDTIVLSGLYHLSDGKDVVKVPLLGHIPIIGELFKSRRFLEKQTELVIFVTPRLADPVSKHLRQVIRDMQRRYTDTAEDVSFDLFD